ncbi:ABC transporter permease subunit [Streptomyces sp. NPDC004111]|uniref:ABC transporter permease subunit n=1 Tax=Streptomyces sp. NPDC004111 TaxID=3364690 RepID=UPI0036881099
MPFAAVLRSEWIKIASVRSLYGALTAVLLATVGITLLAFATMDPADHSAADPLLDAFYALNFGHIAALSFGATALSSEFRHGALRISLTVVPDRGHLYMAKTVVVGALVLGVGLVTAFTVFLTGQAMLGERALDLTAPGAVRACVGAGIYLALMALMAAGLATVLRSAVGALGILVPLILLLSFVFGDVAAGVAQFLPDRAGQQVLRQHPVGDLGPWTGLGVTALWALALLLAGWWTIRRRDA